MKRGDISLKSSRNISSGISVVPKSIVLVGLPKEIH